ncbi:MAG: hypothetical protein P1U39_00610 [Legionellaceae bacterium]|nr:hypothetical protein [Legionellaceae bacterium]
MLQELTQQYSHSIQTFYLLMLIVNAFIHILFAGAVAKDAGQLQKVGQRPALVAAPTWAFATLLGGVFIAAVYWFIHHSTLTRPVAQQPNTQRNN